MDTNTGIFYVVATPIGNLEDITLRAERCLKSVALIAAEDTRRTSKLLNHLNINCPILSCHEHNELERVNQISSLLKEGKDVALVTDAGCPGVSDPGAKLVAELYKMGFKVIPIPGPSAVSTALSVCGMAANRFYFVGFLPRKKKDRRTFLEKLLPIDALLVFFEAPHRITKCLEDMLDILGNRRAFLAREMTKRHESYILSDIKGILEISHKGLKGEITLIVEGAKNEDSNRYGKIEEKEIDHLLHLILDDKPTSIKTISKILSNILGLSKGEIYKRCLSIKNQKKES